MTTYQTNSTQHNSKLAGANVEYTLCYGLCYGYLDFLEIVRTEMLSCSLTMGPNKSRYSEGMVNLLHIPPPPVKQNHYNFSWGGIFISINSAGADGSLCSQVCAHLTLCSCPHRLTDPPTNIARYRAAIAAN